MAAQVRDLPTHLLRRAILGFALIAPIFTVLFYRTNALIALGVLFLSHILLLYPTLVPNSQWWGTVITSFKTSRPQVWITIDDGPDAFHTSKVLDILDRFRARATFFVIGKRITEIPELARDIALRGHQIANHTFSHPSGSFWVFLPSAIEREIDQCSSEIMRSTQTIAKYFRTPAGLKNFFVHPIGARRDLQLVGWTVRGLDTVRRSPEAGQSGCRFQARYKGGHEGRGEPCQRRSARRWYRWGDFRRRLDQGHRPDSEAGLRSFGNRERLTLVDR